MSRIKKIYDTGRSVEALKGVDLNIGEIRRVCQPLRLRVHA
jgi:hypothetical protein